MSNLERNLFHVTLCTLLLLCNIFGSTTFAEELFRAQGEMTGEVSATSAIVQTRLTSVDRNVDGEVRWVWHDSSTPPTSVSNRHN
ncbi:MAG: hypothetical protein CMJ64_25720 [Planctomycetaceae bacterium]|nr:hypothetical protein [Planctomycetaceae bacterium]